MAGRKRAAVEDTEKRETRSSKVTKTEGAKSAGKAAKGTARLKTSMAHSTFKSRAIPLHVSITSTAPAPEGQEAAQVDPGLLASTTLVPSTFSTGSFGWKGNKRMAVELPKSEGEEGVETLYVALTINATVIGSKDVKEEEEHHDQEETEGHVAEASGEAAEQMQGESSPGGEAKEGEETGGEHTEG